MLMQWRNCIPLAINLTRREKAKEHGPIKLEHGPEELEHESVELEQSKGYSK